MLLFLFLFGGRGGTKCSESQADIRKLAYTNYCHCHGTEHHVRLYPNAKVTETGTLENLFIVKHYQGPCQRRSKNKVRCGRIYVLNTLYVRKRLGRFYDWTWGCRDCYILRGLWCQRVAWEVRYQVPSLSLWGGRQLNDSNADSVFTSLFFLQRTIPASGPLAPNPTTNSVKKYSLL